MAAVGAVRPIQSAIDEVKSPMSTQRTGDGDGMRCRIFDFNLAEGREFETAAAVIPIAGIVAIEYRTATAGEAVRICKRGNIICNRSINREEKSSYLCHTSFE